jgi:hypothetical protein
MLFAVIVAIVLVVVFGVNPWLVTGGVVLFAVLGLIFARREGV